MNENKPLRSMSPDELIEECEWLRRELGLAHDQRTIMALMDLGLSPAEAKVLAVMHRAFPRTVTAQMMIEATASDCCNPMDESNLSKVYISRLRKRLGKGIIRTYSTLGYALTPEGEAVCRTVLDRLADNRQPAPIGGPNAETQSEAA